MFIEFAFKILSSNYKFEHVYRIHICFGKTKYLKMWNLTDPYEIYINHMSRFFTKVTWYKRYFS